MSSPDPPLNSRHICPSCQFDTYPLGSQIQVFTTTWFFSPSTHLFILQSSLPQKMSPSSHFYSRQKARVLPASSPWPIPCSSSVNSAGAPSNQSPCQIQPVSAAAIPAHVAVTPARTHAIASHLLSLLLWPLLEPSMAPWKTSQRFPTALGEPNSSPYPGCYHPDCPSYHCVPCSLYIKYHGRVPFTWTLQAWFHLKSFAWEALCWEFPHPRKDPR